MVKSYGGNEKNHYASKLQNFPQRKNDSYVKFLFLTDSDTQ